MVTKTTQSGAHVAAYRYLHGDKVKRVDSTFPDEAAMVKYAFDGLDRLRKVNNGTDVTWYREDLGGRIIAAYDDGNDDGNIENLAMTFPHDPSRLFGTALGVDTGSAPASGAYGYFLQDAYGSTRLLTLGDKSLAGSWEYGPYGDRYHGGGANPAFSFTGQIWDADAGLYLFPARFYSPALARWLIPEPSGIDGPNLYWYAQSRPTCGVDIAGLWYIDFNVTVTWWGGFTVGLAFGTGGIFLYGGPAVGFSIGPSVTGSLHNMSTGWNWGTQASNGPAFQVGADVQQNGYFEVGVGGAGLSGSFYYVENLTGGPCP